MAVAKLTNLTKAEKRKYALANRRFDYGIWGYLPTLFFEVTLTTRERDMLPGIKGNKKVATKFGKDNQRLMKWIESSGYEVEYCGCFEFTPQKHLLHWHGIWRVKGGFLKLYKGDVKDINNTWTDNEGHKHSKHIDANTKALGDKWNELHDSFSISLGQVSNMDALQAYIKKHIIKDYLNQGIIRNKFLVSKGWCRDGIKEINEEFKRWWINGIESGSWMSDKGYKILNEAVKLWCEVGIVGINYKNIGWFQANGKNITNEIYDYSTK